MSAHQKPREKPFLDDPAAYPEFSLLIKRERINHAVRFCLHRHRTVALLVLIAASIAASGGEMPDCKFWGRDGSRGSCTAEWALYLTKGINAPLIESHFEGLVSALGCMLVSCLTALLAYPVYLIASPAPSQDQAAPSHRYRRSNLAARIVAVGAPSITFWAFVVRAAGRFRWGIASGLCVGLFSAALTLKSISFVQHACPSFPAAAAAAARDSLASPSSGAAGGRGSCAAGVTATAAARGGGGRAGGPRTRSRAKAEEEGGGADGTNGAGVPGAPTSSAAQRQGQQGRGGRDGEDDESSLPPLPAANNNNGGSGTPPGLPLTVRRRAPPLLTFWEFAFFLLLAPSLVCEPRLLASGARRPRRIAAAASEFFHAGLAYLAVHATCSAFFAPIMRVLAAALHSGWADEEGWAELLREEGSGWWLLLLLRGGGGGSGSGQASLFGGGGGGGGGGEVCGADGGGGVCSDAGRGLFGPQEGDLVTAGVAACLGMLVLTPLMHFLMFYAFFHAVCLGCAELWGYPDRNIYGPWWLVMDDIRDYFRLWSAPVHRWLSKTIQRPMIEAGQREARRHRHRHLRHRASREEAEPREERVGQRRGSLGRNGGGSGSSNSGGRGGGSGAILTRWWIASLVCSFLVSGVVHEAVAFVAMRRTFWPINTLFLCLAASMSPFWDTLFPVVAAGGLPDPGPSSAGNQPSSRSPVAADDDEGLEAAGAESPAEAVEARARNGRAPTSNGGTPASNGRARIDQQEHRDAAAGSTDSPRLGVGEGGGVNRSKEGSDPPASSSRRRGGAARPEMGSWRGWTAVMFYGVASMPTTLAVDYLVWQWWRHTFLVE